MSSEVSEDYKTTRLFIVFIACVLMVAIIFYNTSEYLIHKKFAEEGYEQVTVPGSASPRWQKVKK